MKFSLSKEKDVKIIFVIFYLVGTIGMLIPLTFPLFKKLIPASLLLCFIYLFYFHDDKKGLRAAGVFSFILLTGIIIEIIGVKTGKIFGEYRYGSSLGPKIFETPVMIGFNWLFLAYTTSSVFERFKILPLLKICLASFVMLIYDVVQEQVAPDMGMWYWQNNSVPLKNYIVWFIIALIFQSILELFKVKTRNPLSITLLSSQFAFFIILLIFLK